MDLYRRIVTEILPDKLQHVPIPNSITGIFKLSISELAYLTMFTGVSGFVAYSVYTTCRIQAAKYAGASRKGACIGKGSLVNLAVHKDAQKVVDTLNVEDIGEKVVLCRCWRSKKFPYCDGAHNKHNDDTGDNVGPIIVKK